jgi:hypothetical protein
VITLDQPRGHQPLRIVATMDEPIGYLGDLLHLDGPLAYGAYHALDLQTRKTIPPIEVTDFPVDLTLPLSTWWVDYDPALHGEIDPRLLKRRRRGKDGPPPQLWGWCCSAADESAWGVRSKLEIRKRPAIKEMGRYTDAKTHNVSAGHMKAYDLSMPTVFAREVTWYAHGELAAVQDLLTRFVPALGKKRSTGSGTVAAWTVTPHGEDWSVTRDGAPTRRLPAGAVEGAARTGAIRPPYYHHTRMVAAVEPC